MAHALLRQPRGTHALLRAFSPQVTTTSHPFRIIGNVSAPYVQPSYNALPECAGCVNVSTGGNETNWGLVNFTVPLGTLSADVGYTCTVHSVMVNRFIFFDPTPSQSASPSQTASQSRTQSQGNSAHATASPAAAQSASQSTTVTGSAGPASPSASNSYSNSGV